MAQQQDTQEPVLEDLIRKLQKINHYLNTLEEQQHEVHPPPPPTTDKRSSSYCMVCNKEAINGSLYQ